MNSSLGARRTPAANPIIVVEVSSPGTIRIDNAVKLLGYFALAPVRHDLILDADRRIVIHHARGEGGDSTATRIVYEGEIVLDPPGIVIDCASCFRFE